MSAGPKRKKTVLSKHKGKQTSRDSTSTVVIMSQWVPGLNDESETSSSGAEGLDTSGLDLGAGTMADPVVISSGSLRDTSMTGASSSTRSDEDSIQLVRTSSLERASSGEEPNRSTSSMVIPRYDEMFEEIDAPASTPRAQRVRTPLADPSARFPQALLDFVSSPPSPASDDELGLLPPVRMPRSPALEIAVPRDQVGNDIHWPDIEPRAWQSWDSNVRG